MTIEPPLARVALAMPATSNRISARFVRELHEACESIRGGDVRVVVLSGQGQDFCMGWADANVDEGYELPLDPFGCLVELPQPVVCAIQGAALDAGLELALAADIRVCSSDARFALPGVGLGKLPPAGGGQRLARLAGRGTAMAMLLAGEELDAQAAYRAGIVSRVVDPAELGVIAGRIAESIAEKGPIATRYAKEAIRRGMDMTLDQALRYETDLTIILQTTEDRAEGVRAFVEKREPEFKGK